MRESARKNSVSASEIPIIPETASRAHVPNGWSGTNGACAAAIVPASSATATALLKTLSARADSSARDLR